MCETAGRSTSGAMAKWLMCRTKNFIEVAGRKNTRAEQDRADVADRPRRKALELKANRASRTD
jgi:hypothetical protein